MQKKRERPGEVEAHSYENQVNEGSGRGREKGRKEKEQARKKDFWKGL